MKLILKLLFLILIIKNVISIKINMNQGEDNNDNEIVFKHHHHEGDSSDSDSFDNSESGQSPSTFQSGNILLTDPTSLNPFQFYEFTTDGDSVYNYTTFLRSNESERCVPNDMGFLNSNTLLLLDSKQGIFEANGRGEVIGYWNNLKTNTINKLGCSLSKMNVDQQNSRVYVSSLNMNCDYNFEIGIFVYNFNGELVFKIQNSNFNTTNGIAGDSDGNIWVTDINEIFIFDNSGKFLKTVSPINPSDKIAYNGIIIDSNDNIYVSVPSYQGDMIIQINKDNGELIRSIKLIGLFTSGKVSGLPGSLALSNKHIYVEVPYASKKEAPPSSSDSGASSGSATSGSSSEWLLLDIDENGDEQYQSLSLQKKHNNLDSSTSTSDSASSKKQKPDIIQSYNLDDGSFNKAWGGHSCNPKNILCIPFSGFLIVP